MAHKLIHQGLIDQLYHENSETIDFYSPSTQEFLREIGTPLWKPTYASRCTNMPMWERPDIFREISYLGTVRLNYEPPRVEYPALTVTPSGMISLKPAYRNASLVLNDADLYHPYTQKVFSILMQFDNMVEHQISAFAGLSLERTRECLKILYCADIAKCPNPSWEYQDTLGTAWRIQQFSPKTLAYIEGMDPLYRAISIGSVDNMKQAPPGAGGRDSIRHNLFSAEVMLRLAESGDLVTGVWGDLFAAEHLFHTNKGDAKRRKSHGDCIVVTKDGSIVIVEIVGSITDQGAKFKALVNKAASWVGVIANSLLDISVLFVDTSWYKDKRNMFNAVDIGIKHESAAYAPDNTLRRKAQLKVGIANAAWWFPENGCVSQAATRLGAYSPVTREFRPFDVADSFYSTSDYRKDAVLNTVAALHTPPWMRNPMKERTFK